MPIALQNHSGLTSRGDDVLKFYKAVNHPNFKLLLDTGHLGGRDGLDGSKIAGQTYDHYYRNMQVATLTQFVLANSTCLTRMASRSSSTTSASLTSCEACTPMALSAWCTKARTRQRGLSTLSASHEIY